MSSTKNHFSRIEEIIQLVRQQEPERTDIIKSLKKCGNGKWTSTGYYQFCLSEKAQKKPVRKLKEMIILEQEHLGFIVLDVYTNGSIAGIEFMNLIEE